MTNKLNSNHSNNNNKVNVRNYFLFSIDFQKRLNLLENKINAEIKTQKLNH